MRDEIRALLDSPFTCLPFRSKTLSSWSLPGFQFSLHLLPSLPLPMHYFPRISAWDSVKTLFPLGVLILLPPQEPMTTCLGGLGLL